MNNQDPQTAIDYNLYPASARPSGLHVPTDLEIKALKEQCGEMRRVLVECDKYFGCCSAGIAKLVHETLNSTTAGRNYKSLEEVAAIGALDGRLGTDNDAIVQACREYVAAEDELPEHFDTEDYHLSKAVKLLVESERQLTAHTQALKVAKKLFQVAGCIDEKCGGKGWYEVVRPDRHGQPEQQQEQCQWCAERAELLATINNLLK